MNFAIFVCCVAYILLSAFIVKTSFWVANLPKYCQKVCKSSKMKSEFEPFLRVGDNLAHIPSRFAICVGAVLFGPLRLLSIVFLLICGGLSTFVFDSKRLAAIVRVLSRGILVVMGVRVQYRGRRALGSEAPCLVANHVSALDMLALTGIGASFVGKAAAEHMPCIGPITRSMGCIFVARDSPESRALARKTISERLSLQWNEKSSSQLVIFPEGTTTNGRGLLQFRRGAFDAQVPIQPVRIEYSNLECSMALLDIVQLICYLSTWMPWEMTIHYLPVVPGGKDTTEICRDAIASKPGVYSTQPLRLFDSGSHRDESELVGIVLAAQ